jgi:hypothetical protein
MPDGKRAAVVVQKESNIEVCIALYTVCMYVPGKIGTYKENLNMFQCHAERTEKEEPWRKQGKIQRGRQMQVGRGGGERFSFSEPKYNLFSDV